MVDMEPIMYQIPIMKIVLGGYVSYESRKDVDSPYY